MSRIIVVQYMKPKGIRFQNADRLVAYSDRYDAMIISVVSIYDTYLGDLFIRLTFPLWLVRWEPLLWCFVFVW